MLFLMGEKVVTVSESLGVFHCPVCKSEQERVQITEKNYFTVFFIRLLPLGVVGQYRQCSGCCHAYGLGIGSDDEPLCFSSVRAVLAYLQLGYGLNHRLELSAKIFFAVTGMEVTIAELQQEIETIKKGKNVFDALKEVSAQLSWFDKSLIVETAFLQVYGIRSIQYEERLQINSIGNVLGFGLEGVNAIIKNLQSQQYRGIRSMGVDSPGL